MCCVLTPGRSFRVEYGKLVGGRGDALVESETHVQGTEFLRADKGEHSVNAADFLVCTDVVRSKQIFIAAVN